MTTSSRWIAACSSILLFASSAVAAEPPRVVLAWAVGPMEARVAFADVVDAAVATGTVGAKISFEDPAAKGRPGGNRGSIRVAAARLEDGGRTLVLVTDPHPREATYSLKLQAAGGQPVSYDLSGVEAAWTPGPEPDPNASPAWSGWWPSFDVEESRGLTAKSAVHEPLTKHLAEPGRLALRAFVNLPQGEGSLVFDASAPFRVTLAGEEVRSVAGPDQTHRAAVKCEGTGEAAELNVFLATGANNAALRLKVATMALREETPRPLPRTALVLPWAPPTPSVASPGEVPKGVLTGGDPVRGEAIFRGEAAKCANCHAMAGKGGAVGPELTSLAGADRAWVYQNIAEPSASIHPEYVSYTVAFKDGRIAMGVVRAEGANSLKVSDIDAKVTLFPVAEIEELRPSPSSIMPVGLLAALGDEGVRDLLAYLTAPAAPASR